MGKKMVTLLCVSVWVLTLIAMPVAGAAGIPNPVRDVTEAEMREETGIWFSIPNGAQEVAYSIIDIADGEAISQAQYMLDGIRYCCRVQPGEALSDISGMHYEWAAEGTVALPFSQAEARYIEGGPGVIIWYVAQAGLNSSISMDAGATMDALEAAVDWQMQPEGDADMMVDYEIQEGSVLTASFRANLTTGYSWTFEISDEALLACESVEYAPNENAKGVVGADRTYVAVFSPTMRGAGAVTLTFRYIRGTEAETPRDMCVFNLWINEAGLLSIQEVE